MRHYLDSLIRRKELSDKAQGVSGPNDHSPDALTRQAEAQIFNPEAMMP